MSEYETTLKIEDILSGLDKLENADWQDIRDFFSLKLVPSFLNLLESEKTADDLIKILEKKAILRDFEIRGLNGHHETCGMFISLGVNQKTIKNLIKILNIYSIISASQDVDDWPDADGYFTGSFVKMFASMPDDQKTPQNFSQVLSTEAAQTSIAREPFQFIRSVNNYILKKCKEDELFNYFFKAFEMLLKYNNVRKDIKGGGYDRSILNEISTDIERLIPHKIESYQFIIDFENLLSSMKNKNSCGYEAKDFYNVCQNWFVTVANEVGYHNYETAKAFVDLLKTESAKSFSEQDDKFSCITIFMAIFRNQPVDKKQDFLRNALSAPSMQNMIYNNYDSFMGSCMMEKSRERGASILSGGHSSLKGIVNNAFEVRLNSKEHLEYIIQDIESTSSKLKELKEDFEDIVLNDKLRALLDYGFELYGKQLEDKFDEFNNILPALNS